MVVDIDCEHIEGIEKVETNVIYQTDLQGPSLKIDNI